MFHFLKIVLLVFIMGKLQGQEICNGYVYEVNTKETLAGVSVTILGSQIGTATNAYGFFSIKIPSGQPIKLLFSSLGYQKFEQPLTASQQTPLQVFLQPETLQLQEVTISDKAQQAAPAEMSVVRLPIAQIKQIPTLLGEKDVIKALQLLPGVQKSTEGSTALYVRGGGPDQNLILLDEAQVYNANHLFGFFSVFNGDAIKNVSFWKGGFPARYGGRLSSVVDLQMKDGGKDKLRGEGGIGLLSSRLSLDGPIQKGKSSFLLSGRRSYIDVLTEPFLPADQKFGYRFYDLNAKLHFDLSAKDKLYLSGYFGNDRLRLSEQVERSTSTITSQTRMGWGNATATLRWNHLFSQKLFLNTTLLMTDFKFRLSDDFEQIRNNGNNTGTYTEYSSGVRDYTLKADFDYFPINAHVIKFGGLVTFHRFRPRAFIDEDRIKSQTEQETQKFDNQEFAVYIEDTYTKGRLSANIGLRLNGLRVPERTYLFAEPRLSAGYKLNNTLELKASYARNNQFVHLLSNTGTGLSTDLWVPVTERVPPQQADQIAFGFVKTFPILGLNLTLESYRKWMRNSAAYREGATFLVLNDGAKALNWEDNVAFGNGLSYGTEVLLQKNKGRFTGWVGYTLSWTIHQFADLNNGKPFYPRNDRRHDASVVTTYKLTPKVTLSANWVHATGNALTVSQGYYFVATEIDNQFINNVDYLGSRNSFRAESFHRLDIAIQFHKQKRWGERTWEVGLYNAYNRKNPLYYYLKSENDPLEKGQRITLQKRALFPVIPSVTYNFKF
ncbi:TonB-dependent receptor plug domain-containing protein [Runella sp. CRIBMP]|uniref:TonB-dependent receptor n=1 Tax=Runella sp. CRIBMP TaxID=2683261 RepID=UPI001411FB3B|nr:TonB-dependent receptor [Runella sp. CRIBMP]NBB19155.1 TonB-dependent receptor plug domain-containing protein [Runella sp. CRIBMP]